MLKEEPTKLRRLRTANKVLLFFAVPAFLAVAAAIYWCRFRWGPIAGPLFMVVQAFLGLRVASMQGKEKTRILDSLTAKNKYVVGLRVEQSDVVAGPDIAAVQRPNEFNFGRT
jgi:hypothetical protein